MNIIFLNRFFYPDHSATSQMLSDLAFDLAAGGTSVAVITSRLRYDEEGVRLPPRETVKGVDVRRVSTTGFGRHNLIGRAVDYLSFYVMSAWALWWLASRGDIVVIKTDPPMLSIIVRPIARMRGAHVVNWLQDIFPEVATALGVGAGKAGGALFGLLRRLRDASLKAADRNVVLGERMMERLTQLGCAARNIRIIPNWADGTLIRSVEPAGNNLRHAWQLDGSFVVGYSGNLGRAHDIETFLAAIAITERQTAAAGTGVVRKHETAAGEPETRPVRWLFIGGGAQYAALAEGARRRGLSSLTFAPYQPRERLAESLSSADVHLISLKPELEGLIVPSKLYGIAAAGRASIFVGDSDGEVARVLLRNRAGVTVAQGDGAALAQAVLTLAADPEHCRELGDNARDAFEREFNRAVAVRRWQDVFADVVGNT